MKNLPGVLLGAASIGTSIFLYMLYKKDKEIEENCGCKTPATAGNGNAASGARISHVELNSMTGLGGVGGGRSASDMEFVKPRGVAVVTFSGMTSINGATFENAAKKVVMNRMLDFDSTLRANNIIRRNPVVANDGRIIQNNSRSAIYQRG